MTADTIGGTDDFPDTNRVLECNQLHSRVDRCRPPVRMDPYGMDYPISADSRRVDD